MRWQREGRVMVLVHGPHPPSDRDWTAYIDEAKRWQNLRAFAGILVITDGVGPSTAQRKQVAEIPDFNRTPVVVVTASRFARGMVTALHWLGVNIKAFAPNDLVAALCHLKLAPLEQPPVVATVTLLKNQMKGSQ